MSYLWKAKRSPTNPEEHVQTITTKCRVQLPEILIKRLVANIKKVSTVDEKRVEESKKSIEENLKENIDNPQAKRATPIREYVPSIPFSYKLEKHKLDK